MVDDYSFLIADKILIAAGSVINPMMSDYYQNYYKLYKNHFEKCSFFVGHEPIHFDQRAVIYSKGSDLKPAITKW